MLYFLPCALACLVERYVGYPMVLQRLFGHPVQWVGALITWLDNSLNTKPDDEVEGLWRGGVAVLILLAATALPAYILQDILQRASFGWVFVAFVSTVFIAQKSMRDHVSDVEHALSSSLIEGRKSVAKIVGRETKDLDESGVAKALSHLCSGLLFWVFRGSWPTRPSTPLIQ